MGIVVSEGTVRGMAARSVSVRRLWGRGVGDGLSPDKSLTKMWKLSEDVDEEVDVEEAFDDEREARMLGDWTGDLWMGRCVAGDHWLYQIDVRAK